MKSDSPKNIPGVPKEGDEAEASRAVAPKHGISEATYYSWKVNSAA